MSPDLILQAIRQEFEIYVSSLKSDPTKKQKEILDRLRIILDDASVDVTKRLSVFQVEIQRNIPILEKSETTLLNFFKRLLTLLTRKSNESWSSLFAKTRVTDTSTLAYHNLQETIAKINLERDKILDLDQDISQLQATLDERKLEKQKAEARVQQMREETRDTTVEKRIKQQMITAFHITDSECCYVGAYPDNIEIYIRLLHSAMEEIEEVFHSLLAANKVTITAHTSTFGNPSIKIELKPEDLQHLSDGLRLIQGVDLSEHNPQITWRC